MFLFLLKVYVLLNFSLFSLTALLILFNALGLCILQKGGGHI